MLLSDLIRQDIELVRDGTSGRYWRWKDQHSFVVDDARGKWNDYGAGAFGDSFDWLLYHRRLTKSEAFKLAKSVGEVEVPEQKIDPAKIFYAQQRLNTNQALRELDRRKITLETAKSFGVGYLSGKIVLPNYIVAGDLCSVRYRCLYPANDSRGKQLRYFSEPGSKPWFPYGLWLLPKRGEVLFIAEGEFKTMCVSQLGYPCLGTQASQFRPSWVEYLEGWNRVVFLRDTGETAGIRSAVIVKQLCPRIEIVRMPRPYKAVDDYFAADPANCRTMLREIANVTSGNVTPEILGSTG